MQTVTTDTSRTTPGGVAFTVPAGWSVASDSSSVFMQSPEADTHVVIFDMQATDAAAAVAQAWPKYRPSFTRPLKAAMEVPDREGWKDGKQFIYETSPNERAVVVAVARHAGNAWTVVLLDGSEPTVEKRVSTSVPLPRKIPEVSWANLSRP